MSVFTVKLNNTGQGDLDVNMTTGVQNATSIQRTVYVMGPNRINRKLTDGETFTDCNYWKRFAYPQVSLDQAIVEVTTDDGSVWSDTASENTYPLTYSLSCAPGSVYSDNEADILTDTGGYAVFTQISNDGSAPVQIRLNGLTTATFLLSNGETQIFNSGDLSVSKIQVNNSGSGASGTATVNILLSVRSVVNS